MIGAWQQMHETAGSRDTDLRTAAYLIAIEKVAISYLDRGIFP
jgi:glutamate dehydrogenase/leucine dehydrogenase